MIGVGESAGAKHARDGIVIRRMTAGDEAKVLAAADLFDGPPNPAGLRDFLSDPRCYLLLACLGETPVGFLRAYELPQVRRAGRIMFLYEIGVASAHRRSGVAAAMIRVLLGACRSRRMTKMFVVTEESNAAGMALYRSTGGRRPARDDVVFVYDLEPSGAIQ